MINKTKKKSSTLKKRLGLLYKDWIQNTSINGISEIYRANNFILKTFWTLILVSLFIMTFYAIGSSFQEYFSYKVFTSTKVVRKNDILFPAVTVCNLKILNTNKKTVPPELDQIPAFMNNVSYYARYHLQNNMIELDEFHKIGLRLYSHLIQIFDIEMTGYDIDEMVISCFFNSEKCKLGSFVAINNKEYGRCFTFNSEKQNQLKISRGGKENGLKLEMYVGEHDLYMDLNKNTGN